MDLFSILLFFFFSLNKIAVKELLQKWREDNVRSPQIIKEIWNNLPLSSFSDDSKYFLYLMLTKLNLKFYF